MLQAEAGRTMTTRVLRERVLALSWGSALLLQVADPRIAQGVADHSVFLNKPRRRVQRLYSTANSMLDLLVGSRGDARGAAARINAIHDRVNGPMDELPGSTYSAHDPALLSWVHIALHATLLRAYAELVAPLTSDEQDQYCREVASIEPLLGIPEGRLPRDAQSLRCAFASRLNELCVGANARRIARGILFPRLPGWASPVTRIARLCSIGFLPPPVRRAYGLHWTRRQARLFQAALRTSRWVLPRVPARLRFVPPELMLRWAPDRAC